MKDNVYIENTSIYAYCNKHYFNPSQAYPEGLDINIKSDAQIYDHVRSLLINMHLDQKNIGTSNWNPFGSFIKPNNKVVIKPNLVKHINNALDGDTDSLITNFAIIRPVIDYCLIALKKKGELIVGDAPVQECDFAQVIQLNGLKDAIEVYQEHGFNIKLIDFRKNNNKDLACSIVSLGNDSSLHEVDRYASKYAITNYDLRQMHAHHHDGIHEYLIPNDVLTADVIINMPKPKTHRKGGMTACMKNFIGINGKKEYLPHHRNGSIKGHGDEYPELSLVKACFSNVRKYTYKNNSIINFFHKGFYFLQKLSHKNRYLEGSWYGNDTIWRTILDINKIVLYADKKGNMTDKPQRHVFNLCDMIISGEKEGPLLPSNKKVGLLVAGFNQLNVDKTIACVMGFDPDKIKYIINGYKLTKFPISSKETFSVYDNDGQAHLDKYNKHFIPTDGWIDYLMKGDK